MTRSSLYTVAMLILLAWPAAAELYHWVDDSGVNHYANSPPPPGIKAESSWAEVPYNATADKAQAAENQRIIRQGDALDIREQKAADNAAAVQEKARRNQIAALESKRSSLAKQLLANRYHFRDQAQPLKRQIADLERQIAEIGDDQAARERLEARQLAL